MSVNEDLIQPSSDSFWEVDCYKRTVKRHEDGHKLCGDLIALIQERADIEKHYAKSLKDWSSKWNKLIEKGPEYGTTEGAWKGSLCEADQVAELHIKVKDSLLNDVQNQIKQWRVENYTKPMVGAIKETKELEDGFRKAQKPWAKRLVKVLKAKKEYHMACKLEKTATHQENNARADSAVSADQACGASASAAPCVLASSESLDEKGQPKASFSCGSLLRQKRKPKDSAAKSAGPKVNQLKKLQDKVEKCKNDVETTKKKYEQALNEINSYNAKYMEDMTEIFNKSQEYEEKRLKFFKEMMFGVQQCLNLSETDDYARIYKGFWSTIENADHAKDLRWWSQNNGIDMPMNWPTFEDYSPEHRNISGKSKKGGGGMISGSDGITLTAIQKNDSLSHNPVQQSEQQHSYDNFSMTNNQNNQQNRGSVYDSSMNPFGDDDDDGSKSSGNSNKKNKPEAEEPTQNPFGDEDWETYDQPVDETKGVPVRALYDYVGQEEDELSFKAGEVFIKLLDADDQGWCTGKKDGTVGLYPNNYVEVVN